MKEDFGKKKRETDQSEGRFWKKKKKKKQKRKQTKVKEDSVEAMYSVKWCLWWSMASLMAQSVKNLPSMQGT